MILLALLLACRDEADEWACVGPLVDLVRWRDQVETERVYGGKTIPEAELAAEEARRVAEAVAKLRPLKDRCELTWSLQLFQEADNPGLRVRERAIRELTAPPAR